MKTNSKIDYLEKIKEFSSLISEGSVLTVKVKGVAQIAILGFVVPGIEIPFPDSTFTVP
jgi:hypothetical protein